MPDLWVDVDTAVTVPVNLLPLLDDTDFKTIEEAVAYNAAGMDLNWNFQTTAGVTSQTNVVPTTAGVYDWTHSGNGMYKIEIPASGGGTINNDAEGFGWFSGIATGVLAWRGPTIGFRAAALNNSLVDGATVDVNVTAMAANVITNTVLATNAITAAKINGNAITAAKLAPDAGAEIADAVWDEVLTGATHNVASSAGRRLRQLQESGSAAYGGFIWIDTVNGTAGTTNYENGTSDNPVDTIADANTLASAVGISRFKVAPGSTITFAAAQNNQVFEGSSWTLALGGQQIVGTSIQGATVSGIAAGTGTSQYFLECLMNATTHIKGTHLIGCGIAGAQTVGEAGDYFFDRCHSAVAGTSTWNFDFGGAIGNTNLNMRNYSGGVQLENMGDAGTDTASIEGQGQVIEGTCTGGTVAIRGMFTTSGVTNLTLSDDARIDVAQINGEMVDVITVDTISELAQAQPTSTPTLATAVMLPYMTLRNKLDTTATTLEVHNDAGTVIAKKTLSDDGTTYSEAKMASGP